MLRIGHFGGTKPTFDCSTPIDLAYDDAKRNAYAYANLAECLHAAGPQGEVVEVPPPKAAPAKETRSWSISGAAGGGVSAGAPRLAATLGGQLSLRTGEYLVFNPVIGFNLLYLSPGADNSGTLAAATAEIGVRIQQPLNGLYFDVSAGGYAGFDINAGRAARFTGGATAAAGVGWRWQRFELGAEARALVPEVDLDRTEVVVLGHAALRFP